MHAQGVAIREAKESRTIIYLDRDFLGRTQGLILSDEREPIPKCLLVGPVIEPQEVRRSVLKAVVRVLRFRDCPLLYQTSRQSGRRRVFGGDRRTLKRKTPVLCCSRGQR